MKAWGFVLIAGALLGCSRSAAPPAGTGARETVQGFYEALFRQEWARAYAALHPESRAQYGPEQFTHLAKGYQRNLGLEPGMVHVRSCEEQGARAIAHVSFAGRAVSKKAQHKDAVVLRHSEAGWGIVLPQHFGQVRTR